MLSATELNVTFVYMRPPCSTDPATLRGDPPQGPHRSGELATGPPRAQAVFVKFHVQGLVIE